MIRSALLTGITWTIACAPAQGALLLLAPEPTAASFAMGSRWASVETSAPAVLPASSSPQGALETVREVVYTEPGELPSLLAAGVPLPLRDTAVRAHLRGNAAEVRVTQRFVNSGDAALTAIYTFPLPENSAVMDMRMVIGARVIASQVRERGEARRVYEDARESGHTTALLEQERPNIFTQSIANIAPGETIDVEIRYLQTLSYDAGEYEFVFPTVVGPRYAPRDRVADAARISPPVLGQGQRSGNDLSIEVTAETGAPITAWAAPAHAVEGTVFGERLTVKLARRDEIANRDFVLRYRSAAQQPAARLFLGAPGADGSHFMLIAEPPRVDVDALVGKRELIFVVDVSGSMDGAPLALAKATLREALAGMRPVDTFDVVVFAGRTARLFDAPRPASAEHLRRATEFIDGLAAGGGTEMADAVQSSLHGPVAAGRHRYVFFLTDGYIGEEAAIARGAQALIAAQRQLGRRARVFGVGIGAAPNSELITGLSRAGEGLPLYIRQSADIARVVNRFQRTIDAPIVTDLSIDWGGIAVDGVYPRAAPDLFASHPLVVHGRFKGPAPTSLRLHGKVDGRAVSFPIAITPASERGEVLTTLWARARIGALELAEATSESAGERGRARAEILAVGLRHHLVTAYTSLVAVDSARRVEGSKLTIVQPVEMVQGTTASTSEWHSIPIGGTSRDYTAVIDMSTVASRDATGARLSGTVGAESRYTVDGQDVPWSTVPTDIRRLEQAAAANTSGPRLGHSGVHTNARTRLRSLVGVEGPVRDALWRGLTAELERLSSCFVAAPSATYRLRRGVSLVVELGPDGGVLRVDLHGPGIGEPGLQRCLRERLEPVFMAHLRPGSKVTLKLRVAMQF